MALIIQTYNSNSRLIEAYSNLGNLLQDYGLLEDALINYQKAFELASNANIISKTILRNSESLEKTATNFQKVLENFITLNNDKKYEIFLLDKTLPDEPTSCHKKTAQISILIVVSAFNREKITKLSLEQTKRYKTSYCHLQVYNDHSTEYDNSFLEPYADETIMLPQKMGIHNLRWYQFKKFLETKFDFIYMTDNDVIHDPSFIYMLETLYELGNRKLPVCLYNSKDHIDGNAILNKKNKIMIKKTAPGVSMFYDRKMVEKILDIFDKVDKDHDRYSWDYRAIAYLGLPWITPGTSYLEHYGGHGSINNIDYESDRAINLTQYLEARREDILNYLKQDVELKVSF